MEIIPFKEPAAWQAQIQLDTTIFILFFKWNALNQYWVMSIYDRNSQPILLGVKVVVNWNLTGQFVVVGMPTGDIVCQNVLGGFERIMRFDMGEIDELFYYEAGELETFAK
jgi:hypothetical protein